MAVQSSNFALILDALRSKQAADAQRQRNLAIGIGGAANAFVSQQQQMAEIAERARREREARQFQQQMTEDSRRWQETQAQAQFDRERGWDVAKGAMAEDRKFAADREERGREQKTADDLAGLLAPVTRMNQNVPTIPQGVPFFGGAPMGPLLGKTAPTEAEIVGRYQPGKTAPAAFGAALKGAQPAPTPPDPIARAYEMARMRKMMADAQRAGQPPAAPGYTPPVLTPEQVAAIAGQRKWTVPQGIPGMTAADLNATFPARDALMREPTDPQKEMDWRVNLERQLQAVRDQYRSRPVPASVSAKLDIAKKRLDAALGAPFPEPSAIEAAEKAVMDAASEADRSPKRTDPGLENTVNKLLESWMTEDAE